MAIEAELFDGTVLEFPDGTASEVIQNTVNQQALQRRSAAVAENIIADALVRVPQFLARKAA